MAKLVNESRVTVEEALAENPAATLIGKSQANRLPTTVLKCLS